MKNLLLMISIIIDSCIIITIIISSSSISVSTIHRLLYARVEGADEERGRDVVEPSPAGCNKYDKKYIITTTTTTTTNY